MRHRDEMVALLEGDHLSPDQERHWVGLDDIDDDFRRCTHCGKLVDVYRASNTEPR